MPCSLDDQPGSAKPCDQRGQWGHVEMTAKNAVDLASKRDGHRHKRISEPGPTGAAAAQYRPAIRLDGAHCAVTR